MTAISHATSAVTTSRIKSCFCIRVSALARYFRTRSSQPKAIFFPFEWSSAGRIEISLASQPNHHKLAGLLSNPVLKCLPQLLLLGLPDGCGPGLTLSKKEFVQKSSERASESLRLSQTSITSAESARFGRSTLIISIPRSVCFCAMASPYRFSRRQWRSS